MASVVYFLRSDDGEIVKIGCSYRPEARLAYCRRQCASLELAATYPGCQKIEGRFHELFVADHSHGEWFFGSEPMDVVIRSINDGSFDPSCLPDRKSSIRSRIALATWERRRLNRPDHGEQLGRALSSSRSSTPHQNQGQR